MTIDNVMTKKTKKTGNVFKQLLGLALVLTVLVALSTMATLVVTGVVEIEEEKGQPVNDIADAEGVCNARVEKDYGDSVSVSMVDDRSSHYDHSSGQYKMFYQVDLYRDVSRQTGVKTFFVNCFVSSSRGVVSRVEYLEQADFKAKPLRRETGNIFGF